MQKRKPFGWPAACAVTGLWFLIILILASTVLENIEGRIFDSIQRMQGVDESHRDDIVIVTVDEATISAFGWPLPRMIWALWLAQMEEFKPRSVGMDLFLTHHLCDPAEDTLLAEVMGGDIPVIMAIGLSIPADQDFDVSSDQRRIMRSSDTWIPLESEDTHGRILRSDAITEKPLPVLLDAVAAVGNVAFDPDPDGIIRRVPLMVEFAGYLVPSFGLSVYLVDSGLEVQQTMFEPGCHLRLPGLRDIHLDSKSRMIMDYAGPPGTFTTFSLVELLDLMDRSINDGDHAAGERLKILENATIIVGVTDPSMMDLPATPVHPRFPGPEIQATVLDNLLRGRFITRARLSLELIVAGILSFIAAIIGLRLRPASGIALLVLMMILIGLAVIMLQIEYRIWFGSSVVFIACIGTYGTSVTLERLAREREQRLVKDAFGKYVSPEVLKNLIEEPQTVLDRRGQVKEITILFSDVKSFSRLCEEHPADILLEQLNEYLSAMTHIVFSHRGTVDKFMGDGLMAFFGHPLATEEHAKDAIDAAVSMQKKMIQLRADWKQRGLLPFQIRIGINTGEVIAGSMGGEGKMDYTVFGKHVNLAQRLESGCDTDGVLVSRASLEAAGIQVTAATEKTIEAKNIGMITAYQIPITT